MKKFSLFFILGTTGVSTALAREEFKLCFLPYDRFVGRIINGNNSDRISLIAGE